MIKIIREDSDINIRFSPKRDDGKYVAIVTYPSGDIWKYLLDNEFHKNEVLKIKNKGKQISKLKEYPAKQVERGR